MGSLRSISPSRVRAGRYYELGGSVRGRTEHLRETTTRTLASLTPREERIIRMRFGIGMNTDHTLEEVGQPR
jgi:hypothetical protein